MDAARRAIAALALCAGALVGCGGAPAPRPALDDAPEVFDVGPPALQLYAVLTADPKAMQGADAVPGMWAAVGGQGARYAPVRQRLAWAPADYALDVALDFADLPDPRVPLAPFEGMAAALPGAAQAQVKAARLVVYLRSDAASLPLGGHVRLAGLAALYAADRWDGLVFDLIARKAWTADAWRAELMRPALAPAAHHTLSVRTDGERRWVYSRGEAKFGRPDVQVRGVPVARLAEAQALLAAALAQSARRPLAVGAEVTGPGGVVRAQACDAPPRFFDGACVQLPAP